MYVTLRQPGTGKPVQVKVGFSWFFLLLSPLYGLGLFIKGMIAHGFGMAALTLLAIGFNAATGAAFGGLVLIGMGLYYGFRGNGLYARRLLIKGWSMEGDDRALALARSEWGLGR